MNDPFLKRYWAWNPAAAAASPRHYQPQPMQKQRPHPLQPPAPSGTRRVVSIPVVDGSEEKQSPIRFTRPTAEVEAARSAAAVKIQSVARGFLVRKGVKVVRRLEAEVEEIEQRVRSSLDLLLGNERERLRVSEMLMLALFKLDGVRGVRDYRRRVIRKAISLQEALDSISGEGGAVPVTAECVHAGGPSAEVESVVTGNGAAPEIAVLVAEECDRTSGASAEEESAVTGDGAGAADREAGSAVEVATECAVEEVGSLDSPQRGLAGIPEVPGTADAMEETLEAPDSRERADDLEAEDLMMDEFVMVESKAGNVDISAAASESPSERAEGEQEQEGASGMEIGSPDKDADPAEVKKGMEEAMGKMVEENAKLKGMVAELLERTTAQSRLVCGLSRRIEDLERKVEKMGRKKRKQHAIAAAKSEADGKGGDGRHRLP